MAKKEKYRKPEAGELFRYAEGGMTGRERNAFERRLQKDLFKAEAAEGFSGVSREEAEHDLGIAGGRIRRRINRRKRIAWYSAAASFAALMIVGTVFFSLNDTAVQQENVLPELRESASGQPEQPVSNTETGTGKADELAEPEKMEMTGTDEMEMAGTDEMAAPAPVPATEPSAGVPLPESQPAEAETAGESEKAEKKVLYPVNQSDNRVRVEARSTRDIGVPKGKGDQAGIPRAAAKAVTYNMVAASDTEPPAAETGDTTRVTRSALPSDGILSYRNYLDSVVVTPHDTTVTGPVEVQLSFTVSPDGRPGQFEVISSPSELYSKEAIRVIKDGPAWLPALQHGEYTPEPSRISIRFSVLNADF
ncbi:MAG: energy transducer TonB [Bacteroidales bacterium]|nr:energy transducer TonB [Bacteroidales bacterium]